MASFPPPDPVSAPAGADADRAARLEALARRRAAAPSTGTPSGRTADRTSDRQPGRRRHPAQRARSAALGLSVVSTAGLAALFASIDTGGAAPAASAEIVARPATPSIASATRTPTAPSSTSAAAGSSAAGSSTSSASSSADQVSVTTDRGPTVVDGAVFHNRWGDVQVEAVFSADGTLSDVVVLRSPDDRTKSVRINDYAVPRLTQEALTVQSAAVHTVSGATYTSDGYRQSLQSAIDEARAAGLTGIA